MLGSFLGFLFKPMSPICFLNRNIQVRTAEVAKYYCLRNLTFHQQLKSPNKNTLALPKSSDLSSTQEQRFQKRWRRMMQQQSTTNRSTNKKRKNNNKQTKNNRKAAFTENHKLYERTM